MKAKGLTYRVYMVRTSVGNLYTGFSLNPVRREYEHNNTKLGAKALRGQKPVRLVWMSRFFVKRDALRVEQRIKELPKEEKESIVEGNLEPRCSKQGFVWFVKPKKKVKSSTLS